MWAVERDSFLRGPAPDEVREIARSLGWSLTDTEVDAISAAARGVEASYETLWATPVSAPDAPPAAHRDLGRPPSDLRGGWAWECDITSGAHGPLSGVRVAVKDSIAVAGVPIRVGSALPFDHKSHEDATVVQRLLDAGARIVGKSHTEDLCIGGSSCTSKPWPLANPHDSTRSAGGSSSGSAILVATGACDLALGADQGGSIRIPAALCGIVGLKPTFGLVPYTGVMSLVAAIDHVGPMARSVREVARALDVLAGPDGRDHRQSPMRSPAAEEGIVQPVAGLRIGLIIEGFTATRAGETEHPGSVAAADLVEAVASRLTGLGVVVEHASIPWHTRAQHIYAPILLEAGAANIWRTHGSSIESLAPAGPTPIHDIADALAQQPDRASVATKLLGILGIWHLDRSRGRTLDRANALVPALRTAYDDALVDYDVLICPTTAPAGLAGRNSGDPRLEINESLAYFHNTCVTNLTGHPAVSVPVGSVAGLPVGAMVTAGHGDDATALRVAAALEDVR